MTKQNDAKLKKLLWEKVRELIAQADKWAEMKDSTWTQTYLRSAEILAKTLVDM